MIAESVNWIRAMQETSTVTSDRLRSTGLTLQIVLASISFIVIVPTFLLARKVVKEFGWDVYKKIGSSLQIQGKQITMFYCHSFLYK